MSLHDRGAGTPTMPHIPQQRSATRDDASLRQELTRRKHPVIDGVPGRWLAALRVATGLAFCLAAFQLWTGSAPSAWLLAVGLGGIGVAVTLGVGLRPSAVAGTLLLFTMWIPGWSLGGQEPSRGFAAELFGAFPVAVAIVLVVLSVTYAGRTWGLGVAWSDLPVVRRHPWLA